MSLLTTKLLTILNAERLPERLAGPHTICATGLPRGGTSSIALLLRELGLFMGDELISFNHEDKRLQDARENPTAFARIARDYDSRHDVWAFKLPVGSRMLGSLVPVLRNPVHVAVTRSPVSVARSRIARQKRTTDQAKFISGFVRFHREWAEFGELAKASDIPIVIVEYEKLVANPRGFVEETVEALALSADAEAIERAVQAISNPGYQRFSGDPDQAPLAHVNRTAANAD